MPRIRCMNILAPPCLVPRTPQASTTSTPGASSTTVMSTSTTSITEHSDRSALAKSVTGWLLFSALVILVGVSLMRRFMHLRRSRQPLRNFFARNGGQTKIRTKPINDTNNTNNTNNANNANTLIARLFPRTTDPPTTTQPNRNPFSRISFSPYVIHHRSQLHTGLDPPPHRGTTALDIDASGRRLVPDGVMVVNDHDGVLSNKDALPAYDGAGGPPKYCELHALGRAGMGVDGGVTVGNGDVEVPRGLGDQNLGGAQVQLGTDCGVTSNTSPDANETNPSPAYDAGSNAGHSPASWVDPTSTSLLSAIQLTSTPLPPPS